MPHHDLPAPPVSIGRLRSAYLAQGFIEQGRPDEARDVADEGLMASNERLHVPRDVYVPAAPAAVTGLGQAVSLAAVSYPWWGWIADESAAPVVALRWWTRGRRRRPRETGRPA